MSERLKELLDKINQDGIKKAEEKAREIKEDARKEAEKIVGEAEKQASRLIASAEEEMSHKKKSVEDSLRQAARDLVLSLKEEIRKMLDKIISQEAAAAVSSEKMPDIISRMVENYVGKGGDISDIKVLLGERDYEALRDGMIARLKEEIKKGVEFKASSEARTGFFISFDRGRSFFDITEEGIKESLKAFLNPDISRILQ